jgi:hypothetical protein
LQAQVQAEHPFQAQRIDFAQFGDAFQPVAQAVAVNPKASAQAWLCPSWAHQARRVASSWPLASLARTRSKGSSSSSRASSLRWRQSSAGRR